MKDLPAINLTGSNRLPHIFGRLLIFGFFGTTLILLLSPWQQFVRGSGRVIAFDPLDRRVNVEALVKGQVKHMHVVENSLVKKGDLIAEIQDNDPNLLQNIRIQKETIEERLRFTRRRIESMNFQIEQEKLAKDRAVESAIEDVNAAEIARTTAQLNFDRVEKLFKKGIFSERDHEMAILKRDETVAKLRSTKAKLEQTKNIYDSKIASVTAKRDSAESDLTKAREELTKIEIDLSQNQRQLVTAPRDGRVFSVSVTDGTYLKEGDLICVIIPETESRFVEVWVDGNDMPLIHPRKEDENGITKGSSVRLTFEGWPAIQVVGWPSVSTGTFGGEVMFVDATDNGKGQFRVLVGPDPDVIDRGDGPVEVSWPSGQRWLRQGVQARAWIMLDQVPLWFELWRQINGFPAIGMGIEEGMTDNKK